ncbi:MULTISPECIES: hypothetical protein [Xenorhabdus]|uniref:MarR family transcriptional regulator n=1 Tax=Xenorhabdus khoisanae TaxID=880157 RepID=A0A0J5FSR5_9GAMM|nr:MULTISPECIES: hypothetical protein [Xenorhabdus]KLU17138.1 hypothetical protein AAY47_01590 [Xenorhabdus griffiniae]KMJ44967.1 hypothetical protein AB204_11525 [Xenorhabdus khoisanae]KOP32787.1 hypothetical protein AFK69_13870 [Xenorhabdus sp. GDc328]
MDVTEKQKSIIRTVWIGVERGNPVDMDELLEMLPYKTSKQSMQFSIRALIKKGIVVKSGLRKRATDGYNRVVYELTDLGRAVAKMYS